MTMRVVLFALQLGFLQSIIANKDTCISALKNTTQELPRQVTPQTGDLLPEEINKIQLAAELLGHDIYVVGSAAKGKRRNVGADLPLGEFGKSKDGTKSDIDYIISIAHEEDAAQIDLDHKLPDIDLGFGARGVNRLNLRNSPAIRFSPGKAPEFIPMQDNQLILSE